MRLGALAARRPVDLACAALDDATTKLREVLAITTRWVAGVDRHSIEQLAVAVATAIHRGEAAHGIGLTSLLQDAGLALGRARDRHFTSTLGELADLTVRMTAVGVGARSVRCEHLYVVWARVGRDRNSLATDRVRHVTPGIRLAGIAISCDDRHLATLEIPFVTGTRHDRASARADRDAIARLTAELGRPPNSSPAEHFQELLDLQRSARARIHEEGSVAMLDKLGFSDLVIAGSMPCGPAPKRSLAGAKVYWPGRDADLVGVLRRAGKRGVAHLGRRLMRTPNDMKRDLTDAGFKLRRCPFSPADARLANEAEWGVTWYWNGALECLSRVCVDEGTMSVDNWRVIGLADDLDVAVALVRRHEQPWANEFMAKTMRDTAPGLVKASSYRSDAALRALLRVGIAVLVDAERRARARPGA